ncbi:hypothetical protein BE04_37700 [Sorangium cellulosum]|uniref:Uncharacterized protein n=1 Tax=Sorangium cellulosum TaxID=56 RepID=A0A150P0Y2_SORCE|nr:hypothetical protein BE04_37700 [Sorangium cellulosum]
MSLSYQLLLDLYRGRSAVVEQMNDADRAALRLDTPLARFIGQAARDGSPRHIVLTGNAGDGKTFAALTSQTAGMSLIRDASADPSGGAPIKGLAKTLTESLDAGSRLLIAINRGQLERLAEAVSGQDTTLGRLVAEIRRQSTLRESWSQEPASDEVAVIDLGLCDWTADEVIEAMLQKAATVDLSGVTGSARTAAEEARKALSAPHVRGWVRRVMQSVRGEGRHMTMRQLWSFTAFLVTGGLRPDDASKPLGLSDTVGARLFAYNARRTPLENALPQVDPARLPEPGITRMLLSGAAPACLSDLAGVGRLATDADQCRDGVAAVRAAVVHDPARAPKQEQTDTFTALVKKLSGASGWQRMSGPTRRLLKGIYKALGLWCADPAFPAWQVLCYDSVRYEQTPAVANGEIAPDNLVLALPRPPPRCEQALGGSWRPPYVWMSVVGREEVRLRLTPRLLNSLYLEEPSALDPSDELLLARWLARLPAPPDPNRVRIARRATDGESARPLSVTKDEISGRIRIEEA